jgi:hypothetical protein
MLSAGGHIIFGDNIAAPVLRFSRSSWPKYIVNTVVGKICCPYADDLGSIGR